MRAQAIRGLTKGLERLKMLGCHDGVETWPEDAGLLSRDLRQSAAQDVGVVEAD